MQVKVWNDNTHPYTNVFKGTTVTIPPKAFIEMEFYEAHELKGIYKHPEIMASGVQDPKSMSMLRIERPTDGVSPGKSLGHQCQACKHMSPSPEELAAHINVHHSEAQTLSMPEEDAAIAARAANKKAKTA